MKQRQPLGCLIYLTAVVLPLFVSASIEAQIGPFIQMESGSIRGSVDADVEKFEGIPYATPPTGALRWRSPQVRVKWDGILDAFQPGPDCPQPANSGARSPRGQSEDCLTLSVWAPKEPHAATLPVLVWLHGGAFTMGGTASLLEDGAALARKGVIVVTLNYRLGLLGWFAHPELSAEADHGATANFALMDQIAALRWVQANIGAFGGDPHRVTLAGESAGGWSVALLMVAPSARGLFTQAIIESSFGREPATPMVDAERAGAAFARSHGANDLAALRRLPASSFIAAGVEDVDPKNHLGPILDGVLLPRDIESVFGAGQQDPVRLLVGSNSFDASLFPGLIEHPEQTVFKGIPSLFRPIVRHVYGDLPPQELAAELLTDKVFAEPARFLARSQRVLKVPTYRYLFDYVPAQDTQAIQGAMHATEVAYVFGNLPANATAIDRATSAAMMNYWVNFITNGDPNAPPLSPWPKGGDPILLIRTAGITTVAHFHEARLNLVGKWMTRSFLRSISLAAVGLIAFTTATYLWFVKRRRREL